MLPDFKSLQVQCREILMYAIHGGPTGECFICPLQSAKLYKEKKASHNCTRFLPIDVTYLRVFFVLFP